MKEELDKIYEIATRVLAEPPDGDTALLVEICTLIEEAAQSKPAHWTPRERMLREALEKVRELGGNWMTQDEVWPMINAALAGQPPPDPREEALRLAITALETASGAFNAYVVHHAVKGDEVKRAKNQSLRDDMDAALTAIAAVKGEK